ncbi:MAG: hypothetical protein ACOX6J_00485 [Oscillospiraceae bacterium]|jgi:hypothetical protein
MSKLFDENITPSCSYCVFGRDTNDNMISCDKTGVVSPYFRCKHFKYNPIRRKPQSLPKLQVFDPSEFSLK